MGKYSCYKEDCFGYCKAQCWVLNDTTAYQDECPFHKTIKEYICEEKHKKNVTKGDKQETRCNPSV